MSNNFFRVSRRIAYWLIPCVAIALSGCAGLGMPGAPGTEQTALDRYVAESDPSYTYSIEKTIDGEGYSVFVIDLTSQSWRSPDEVDRTEWKHWLTVIKPDELKSQTGLLFIGGGRNGQPAPDDVDGGLVQLALASGSAVAELGQVPNQPLVFAGETEGRREDSLIAYTWDKYMRTGDDNWPARLPMTKSAVRAMDTITSVLASPEGGNAAVNQFVVAGGSKRGWTTWTTAAVDDRVVAIVPIVIDMLNVVPSFMHHWEAYGFWAPAVDDYVRMGIMDWMGTPEYESLLNMVEPYEYRSRYTMPKLLMNATGDQFFLPDSAQFYYEDLPGETYLRYVPNADHSLDDTDALETLLAFYGTVLNDAPRPRFRWSIANDDSIRVIVVDKPSAVRLWQATNPDARDFRVETIGKVWTSTLLEDQGNGVYIARVPEPESGWTAFFVELTYPVGGPTPLKVTTQVHVVPDEEPFVYKPPAVAPKGFLSGGTQ